MPKFTFDSAFQIGQRVSVEVQGAKLAGHVRAVTFTSSKVRYAVSVILEPAGDGRTTLHNIDSAFVTSEPNAEIIEMPEDNFS